MHMIRSHAARRGLDIFVRVAAFSVALTALTGIVVADVIDAGVDEPPPLALVDEDGANAGELAAERGPGLLVAAVVVPDALMSAVPIAMEDLEPPAPPKKKRKLKFGRFEGY